MAVWRETPFFTPRERAALAWTEAVTLIATRGAPDDVYAALSAQFTPKEQMDLTLAISMINCWNRLAISFRKMPARAPAKLVRPLPIPAVGARADARPSRGERRCNWKDPVTAAR